MATSALARVVTHLTILTKAKVINLIYSQSVTYTGTRSIAYELLHSSLTDKILS